MVDSWRAWLAAALALAGALPPCLAGEPVLRWLPAGENAGQPVAEVTGLDAAELAKRAEWTAAQWRGVFAVFVVSAQPAAGADVPPMAGSYRVEGGTVRFQPAFPLMPGMQYRAWFQPSEKEKGQIALMSMPAAAATAQTRVLNIYPSAATVPENLLKFYVHFSAPMKRGDTYKHVSLLVEGGAAVDLPFLELDEELWNPAMTRLTLIIDPGRIKRGVKPLEDVGPALEAGKRMRLVIDSEWQDAAGKPLGKPFEKAFEVVAADRTPPDPARWKITAPQAGTRDALVVQFGEALDQAIAQRVIQVRDAKGRAVEGVVELTEEEQTLRFIPADPWRSGKWEVVVPTSIEDLAGNNIGKSFDVDLHERPPEPQSGVVRLPVEVR